MKLIDVSEKTPNGEGAYSSYYKLSRTTGVKALNDCWYSKKGAEKASKSKSRNAWYSARRELALLERAHPSGITPKPIAVVLVKDVDWDDRKCYKPGILMEHIPGKPLWKTNADYIYGGTSVSTWVDEKMRGVGVAHNDLHGGNLIVTTRGKKITKVRVIDFTPRWCKRVKKSNRRT